jgi:GAF domain-containing protein
MAEQQQEQQQKQQQEQQQKQQQEQQQQEKEPHPLRRAGAVGVAMMGDIFCNYPLWIAAKRMGAAMKAFPGDFRSLYRVSVCVSI